jgi:hypothetical protein
VEPNFLPAARFSLRRCLSVFCACFFCSFFGFAAPFIMTSQPTRTPLSPYRVSGHFRFDSAISAVGRGRGLHMRTGDEARVTRTSVQERVKRGAARN